MGIQTFVDIRCFHGLGALGNTHRVVRHEHLPHGFEPEDYSRELGAKILVLVSHAETQYSPVFFHRARAVSFCGSGCVAMAAALHHSSQVRDGGMDTESHWDVQLNDRRVRIERASGTYALSTVVDVKPRRLRKAFWEALIRSECLDVIQYADSYVVVEIENAKDLALLKPNLSLLKKKGGPSLIVTAFAGGGHREDYVMRYFAPQYGNPEDAATGSANLLLMKYWQLKLNKKYLAGRQLSKEGGLFRGTVSGHRTTLFANAEPM